MGPGGLNSDKSPGRFGCCRMSQDNTTLCMHILGACMVQYSIYWVMQDFCHQQYGALRHTSWGLGNSGRKRHLVT